MTKHITTCSNKLRRLKSKARDIRMRYIHFKWTTSELTKEWNTVLESHDFKSLPEVWQNMYHGFVDGICDRDNYLTTHAYLCQDGQFRLTTVNGVNDEYAYYSMPSENEPRSLISDTYVLLWKDKPTQVYATPDQAWLNKCEGKYKIENKCMTIDLVKKQVISP